MEEALTDEETSEESSESKEEEKEDVGKSLEDAKEHSEFQATEKAYKEICMQLEKMKGMENFTQEYTKLFEVYIRCYFHAQDLAKVNKSLSEKISQCEAKLITADEDKKTVLQLRTELEHVQKMADAAHTREQNARDILEEQKEQLNKLTSEIEQRTLLGFDQEETGAARKDRENFMKERDNMLHEIVVMKDRLNNAAKIQEELEKKNSAAEQKCDELKQALENQESEMTKELRVRERLEYEVKHLTSELDTNQTELENLTFQLSQTHHNMSKLEATGKEFKASNERLVKEVENLNSRLIKMQQDFEAQNETVEKLVNENYSKTHGLKVQDEELTRLRLNASKIEKIREHYVKKLTAAKNQKTHVEQEKEKQKIVKCQLQHDLEGAKKDVEHNKKVYEALQREKDILSKNILKMTEEVCEQQKMIKLQDQVNKNLQIEIENQTLESKKLKKTIINMDKDRDKFLHDSQELTQKLQEILDEMKLKQMTITDYKKKLAATESKLQMQQNLFETVRSDRNTFSKMLLESQDENSELKQKLKVMIHQTEQLKEDITTKETHLMKGELALQRSEKEKENLKVELKKLKNELHECKEQIRTLHMKEKKLQKMIQDADKENEKHIKTMEQVMKEREILGAKLMKKNDELSLLYEKDNLLQNILQKGEQQYSERLDDIRLLKLEVQKLRQERNLLSKSVNNMTDMRQEIFHLERDLTREKLKCCALEEELQSPINIHRWRRLEGSDPDTYTLIQKVQLLQKRLLVQAQNTIKNEAQLQESERLYQNLRELISRQPGPDVMIRLQKTQLALKERGKKMKCLISELNVYESQVAEYKLDLQRTKEELQEVKKKYFALKKHQHKIEECERQSRNNQILPSINTGNTNHFMGGGFNISAPQKKFTDKNL